MMGRILCRFRRSANDLATSQLYNEQTFYRAFERDLACCRSEAIIESPYITTRRVRLLVPALQRMVDRGVKITVNTRDPEEHDDYLYFEAGEGIAFLQDVGVNVLFTGGHHRKLAIFDGSVLWEGSLNILSQNDSCEIMRRTESEELARQLVAFLGLQRFL